MTTQIDLQSNSTIDATEQQIIEARRLAAWERDRAQIDDFFNDPMKYVSTFWQEYKPIVYILGAILAALFALNIVFGIIGFVTHLPIVSGLLELVGLGYTVWFVNRYLLKSETRQELSQTMEEMKQDVIGATKPATDEFKNAIQPAVDDFKNAIGAEQSPS
ncbi:CAAD domain-containing protein [Leptolyngbya sp. NIES-2104]|uniref:CAAD domain-containing protein n=1 Tax=Leptolyngbya sp. NIES-2104 TaxID=1552121 RepID=UPI0006EC5090|nr:CAAD domain-containing protein [Leptolyngbya sp. NIES-2104]GAP95625.1 hemolysin and related proteins containing CBS domains [Leptolyngbya sp. NIES-2104]